MAETDAPPPEPDRVLGAPHPREAARVLGHDDQVASFVDAARGGRLHHAWLLAGPRGVGKASFAWLAARWLLADSDSDDLTVAAEHPVSRRILAQSEGRLNLVRRPWDAKAGRLRAEITVDEIRKLLTFFQLTATDGGRRVAIIDAADELNGPAANALLKMLEEPPRGAIIFLVAHRPARLLPTIRSRCRTLRFSSLPAEVMGDILRGLDAAGDPDRLAALSAGSVGEALRLAGQGGLGAYQRISDLFSTLPRMDRSAALKLADAAGGRPGAEGDPFDLTVTLLDRYLTRLARTGLMGAPLPEAAEGEGAVLTRLCPDADAARGWAAAQAELSARARAGKAVNLDASALVMDMLVTLAQVPAAHGQQGPT